MDHVNDPSDPIDIAHLARLARLSMGDQDSTNNINLVRADLTRIIAMIDQMQSVNTDDVEPMANPLDATQRLREDRVTEEVEREIYQQNAPATQDGYYLVPRVVE